MKPSFALNLTEEGVTLLHRTARGWLDVGHTTFSNPDLPAALDYLRSTALGLAPKGVTTKLVIPNSQILYLDVEVTGSDDAEKRQQIEAALVGRTPYDVSDLVYDWSEKTGSTLHVAVVAKETLAEAEAFATEHRFNPVSFAAIPDTGFDGEPFFGTSSVASSFLKKSEKVERDTAPIQIIPREIPEAEEEIKAAEDIAPQTPAPETVPAIPEPAPVQAEISEPSPAPEPETTPVFEDVLAVSNDKSAAKDTAEVPPADVVEEAPMALDVEQDEDVTDASPSRGADDLTAPKSVVPSVLDELPPAPSTAALAAFASRRSGEVPLPPARSAGVADPKMPGMPASVAPSVAAPNVPRPAGAKPPPEKPAPKAPKFSYDDPVPPPPRMPGDPPMAAPQPSAAKQGKGLRNLVTAPSIPGTRNKKALPPQIASRPAITPGATSAAEVNPDALAMGLGARKAPQRGKPRFLGLILTGILLLLLALVAGLSSVYLGANDPLEAPPEAQAALLPPDAPDTVPAPDDEMLADMQDPADFADSEAPLDAVDTDLTADVATEESGSEPVLPLAVEEAPEPVVAQTAEPAPEDLQTVEPPPQTGLDTNVAAATAPGPEGQDEIFLAGMDAPPAVTDPLTLAPPSARADTLPGPQMPPPPFGTVYRFDADGRIIPTAEGITTPEGVTLVAGRPSILPPQRPAAVEQAAAATAPSLAPPPEAPAVPAVVASDVLLPADTFAADPSLEDARPRNRPAGLTPTAPEGGEDDASLAPSEDSRFASLRPRLRPASILAAGETAPRTSDAASLAVQAVAAAAAADAAVAEAVAFNSGSPLAVAVSRVPAPRPRNMESAVQAAVAAATQPSRTPAPQADTPTAPEVHEEEADSEPEVASSAPRIPTKANVAKQATFVNAINLSKINLIGVYGTQSKRYALVRQSNGRYKKVRVGDNVDGGTVQAITATEVRYQKGGRLLTLAMPRG